MKILTVALAAGVAGAALGAAPAAAVVTTFATFSDSNSNANFLFSNSGTSARRTTDATVYTTSSKTASIPGSTLVRFSFLQNAFVTEPVIQNVTAKFTFFGTIAKGTAVQTTVLNGKTQFDQPGLTGTFSFLSTTAITVTGPNFYTHTYAAGSNLLSASFSGADITGKIGGSSGASDASTLGRDTVTYTSDFLNFTPTVERDLGLTFTAVNPVFAASTTANKALRSFRTVVGGQFSSDPAPVINGVIVVPEPGVWMLMVAGFGLVGVSARRRGPIVAA